jgi:hypothetical protein
MSRVQLLLHQMDGVYARLRERLAGLTDDEYFWEPAPGCWTIHRDESGAWVADYAEPDPDPAPVTTIGWRLVHVADCKVMYHEWAFGPGKLAFPDLAPPATAAGAIVRLEEGPAVAPGRAGDAQRAGAGRASVDQLGRAVAGLADLLGDDRPRWPPRGRDRLPARPVPGACSMTG